MERRRIRTPAMVGLLVDADVVVATRFLVVATEVASKVPSNVSTEPSQKLVANVVELTYVPN